MEDYPGECTSGAKGVLMNSNDLMQTEQEWLQEYEDTQSAAHHSEELNQQRRTQMASSYDQEDNVLTVWLQEKSSPKAPSYTGKGLAWGKATRVAVWHNVSRGGKDYLKIKLEEPRDSAPSPGYTKRPADKGDIPF